MMQEIEVENDLLIPHHVLLLCLPVCFSMGKFIVMQKQYKRGGRNKNVVIFIEFSLNLKSHYARHSNTLTGRVM